MVATLHLSQAHVIMGFERSISYRVVLIEWVAQPLHANLREDVFILYIICLDDSMLSIFLHEYVCILLLVEVWSSQRGFCDHYNRRYQSDHDSDDVQDSQILYGSRILP